MNKRLSIKVFVNGATFEIVGRDKQELLNNAIGFYTRRGIKFDVNEIADSVDKLKDIPHNRKVKYQPGLAGLVAASKAFLQNATHDIVGISEINRRAEICRTCPLFVKGAFCGG